MPLPAGSLGVEVQVHEEESGTRSGYDVIDVAHQLKVGPNHGGGTYLIMAL